MIDFTKLVPGGRLRMRDYHNGMLVDCTFIGFVAGTTMRVTRECVAKSGERFGRLELPLDDKKLKRLYLYVYRDCFCGDRGIASRDVVELLPSGTDLERARRIAYLVKAESERCAICRSQERAHRVDDSCPGTTLVPELRRLSKSLEFSVESHPLG